MHEIINVSIQHTLQHDNDGHIEMEDVLFLFNKELAVQQ